MKIVCFGDSITFGEYVESPGKWTDLLQEKYPAHTIINKGVCADTTVLGLCRIAADVQRQRPDVVLIQFGYNDANHWDTDMGLPRVSLPVFRAALTEMVTRSRHFGAKHVFLLGVHKTTRTAKMAGGVTLEESVEHYDATISIVSRLTKTPYIDMRTWFESTLDLDNLVLDDQIHLSPKGNKYYLDGLLRDQALRAVLDG